MGNSGYVDAREACPCGSGRAYGACCGPLHAGGVAASAEALMRSRYSAYVRRDARYLLATWHPSTRPEMIEMNDAPHWLGLIILHATAEGDTATVEFEARFQQGKRMEALHETSRFVREGGAWFYVDGVLARAPAAKVGRNEPCPCGSGRKFKQCCGK